MCSLLYSSSDPGGSSTVATDRLTQCTCTLPTWVLTLPKRLEGGATHQQQQAALSAALAAGLRVGLHAAGQRVGLGEAHLDRGWRRKAAAIHKIR